MKTRLYIIAFFLMTAVLLTACGGNTSDTTDPEATREPVDITTEEPETTEPETTEPETTEPETTEPETTEPETTEPETTEPETTEPETTEPETTEPETTEPETTEPETTEPETTEPETTEPETTEPEPEPQPDTELISHKEQAVKQIAALEMAYLVRKADYYEEDYAKITEALAKAKTDVEQAADKAAVDGAITALNKSLAAYVRVADGLYNAYLALKGNIVRSDATEKLVAETAASLAAAQAHYAKTPEKLTAYNVGGAVPFDLVNALTVLCTAYTSTNTSHDYSLIITEPDGSKTVYPTLAYVEATAKKLVADIKAAEKLDVMLYNANTIITLGDQYKAWLTFTNLLSAKNLPLVTNRTKLEMLVAETKNLLAAQQAFGEKLFFDAVNKVPASIFTEYHKLADGDEGKTLYSNYETVYVKIDAILADWQAQYNLSNAQVKDIIATDYVVVGQNNQHVISHNGFDYNDYIADRDLCKKNYDAYIEGSYPDGSTWSFDTTTGTLTISGKGAMEDYTSQNTAPWEAHTADIVNVVIQDGVTSIGAYAFWCCASLESVEIPASVTSIGDHAFYLCTSLKSITIPEGVTSIGDSAFASCLFLESVELSSGVTAIGAYAFDDCASLKSITVPASVTSIGESAFRGCLDLTIRGYRGSAAAKYAAENNITFFAINEGGNSGTGGSAELPIVPG